MTYTERFSSILLLLVSIGCAAVILASVQISIAHAQAGAATANAQCIPPGPPSKGGKDGLPCQLNVAGGTQFGICGGGICHGKGSQPGQGAAQEGVGGGAVDSGFVDKFLQGIQQMMQGGGGGGTPPSGASGATEQPNVTDLLNSASTLNQQNLSNLLNGNSSSTDPANSLLQNIADSFNEQHNQQQQSGTVQTEITDVTEQAQTVLENIVQTGNVSSNTADTENNNQQSNTATNPDVPFSTDVQENEQGVVVTGGGVDTNTNTGISGFFGLFRSRSESQGSLFGRLCEAKPWESTLITRIFTSSFFDSLCEEKVTQQAATLSDFTTNASAISLRCTAAVQPGEVATIEWSCGEGVRSAGVGFNTNGKSSGTTRGTPEKTARYTLECAQGGTRSCTITVAEPRVDIVAYPDRVQLNARSRLYWVGENVESCEVSGPGLTESGVRGAVTTSAILDTTSFTVTCTTAGGATTTDSVIVDIGQ